MTVIRYILVILLSYVLGCSNMALYLSKLRGVDMRKGGSGNLGASNAMILMGWKAGIIVAVHDIGKAVVAVVLAKHFCPGLPLIGAAAGVACVFPPFRSRALYRAPPASSGTCSRSICASAAERGLRPISA